MVTLNPLGSARRPPHRTKTVRRTSSIPRARSAALNVTGVTIVTSNTDPIIGGDGAKARQAGLRGLQAVSVTFSVAAEFRQQLRNNCDASPAGFFSSFCGEG